MHIQIPITISTLEAYHITSGILRKAIRPDTCDPFVLGIIEELEMSARKADDFGAPIVDATRRDPTPLPEEEFEALLRAAGVNHLFKPVPSIEPQDSKTEGDATTPAAAASPASASHEPTHSTPHGNSKKHNLTRVGFKVYVGSIDGKFRKVHVPKTTTARQLAHAMEEKLTPKCRERAKMSNIKITFGTRCVWNGAYQEKQVAADRLIAEIGIRSGETILCEKSDQETKLWDIASRKR